MPQNLHLGGWHCGWVDAAARAKAGRMLSLELWLKGNSLFVIGILPTAMRESRWAVLYAFARHKFTWRMKSAWVPRTCSSASEANEHCGSSRHLEHLTPATSPMGKRCEEIQLQPVVPRTLPEETIASTYPQTKRPVTMQPSSLQAAYEREPTKGQDQTSQVCPMGRLSRKSAE